MMKERKAKFPYWLEHEILERCKIPKERFHKVRGDQWSGIYRKITDKFADKTKIWKNGLHWANTNGYSPKSMNDLLGCCSVDYATWFYQLPQIIPAEDNMVYFLIDRGGDWYLGEQFWMFEACISELVQVLALLTESAFLGLGGSDYYIVSKKYKWIIGMKHHDVVSFVGAGLKPDCLISTDR